MYALLTDFLCISVESLPIAGALRPRGSTGDSQLHCHLLSGGAGWEDTDTLPQPPHRHHCQTQHMGSCTGKTVHIALCDTVLHCVRHHCQTQHMGSCTGETVHIALHYVTPFSISVTLLTCDPLV